MLHITIVMAYVIQNLSFQNENQVANSTM